MQESQWTRRPKLLLLWRRGPLSLVRRYWSRMGARMDVEISMQVVLPLSFLKCLNFRAGPEVMQANVLEKIHADLTEMITQWTGMSRVCTYFCLSNFL